MFSLLLLLPLAGDVHDRAGELLKEGEAHTAAALLQDHLERTSGDPEAADLYARALAELDRRDESAHWYDLARAAYLGDRDHRRDVGRIEKAMKKVDSLASKREGLVSGLVRDLGKAAEALEEAEQPERAYEVYRALVPLAEPKERAEFEEALERIGARDQKLDLDASSTSEEGPGSFPMVELETEHYLLRCALEPEVIDQLAITVEDVFQAFTRIYFDGDLKRAPKRKVTITVHATWNDMVAVYGGTPSPGLQGWWSPGEAAIHAYDNRTRGGSLDATLNTLLHEGSHQFMSTFARGGTPAWINEGTACFFEGAQVMVDGRVLWPDAAQGRLFALAADLSANPRRGPRGREVITFPGPGSYPGNYYHHGWGLVYFLQQWEDPVTLEYAYRPIYLECLDEYIGGGGDSLSVFQEVVLGEDTPLGITDMSEFLRQWEAWILNEVLPFHRGQKQERRALRMARAKRYFDAALSTEERGSEITVSEEELLLRALGDLEFVRKDIDGDTPRRDVLELLVDTLERLDRRRTAATMLEILLDAADRGVIELDPETYRRQELRLAKLDRSNYALRKLARARRTHAGRFEDLLEDYAKKEPDHVLRPYTLAAHVADALGRPAEWEERTAELRSAAKKAGRLLGRVEAIDGSTSGWKTVFSVEPENFRVRGDRVSLAAVRPMAMIDPSVEANGEYEVRAQLVRGEDRNLGTAHGLVVRGSMDHHWWIVGIDDEGHVGVWEVRHSGEGSARIKFIETLYLDEPVAEDEDPLIAVRLAPNGTGLVRVEGREAVALEIDESEGPANFGVFVRDGDVEVHGLVVEIFP